MRKMKLLVAAMALSTFALAGVASATSVKAPTARDKVAAVAKKIGKFSPKKVRLWIQSKAFKLAHKVKKVCLKAKFQGDACKKAFGKVIGLGNKIGWKGQKFAANLKTFLQKKGAKVKAFFKNFKFGKLNFKKLVRNFKGSKFFQKMKANFKKLGKAFKGKLGARLNAAKGKFLKAAKGIWGKVRSKLKGTKIGSKLKAFGEKARGWFKNLRKKFGKVAPKAK